MSDQQSTITSRFGSPEEFSQFIELEAIATGETIVSVILAYCEENDVDEAVVAKFVSRSLKEKIAAEYEGVNLLGNNEGILPI